MKYVIILGDGMADLPISEIENKTPLEYATTPMMDDLSSKGEIGLVHTIPEGMKPGSDTANLAVLGYNPKIYYSGRSPLEALSIGVSMADTDVALRCNLVTLSEEEDLYENRQMIDHSSDEISTEDAGILLEAVKDALENDTFKFFVGTSYRHCLIWNKGEVQELTPPHDILGQCIQNYLPDSVFLEMMKKSYEILSTHPLNIARKEKGLKPANSCWFWGAGTKPALSSFEEKYGKKGAMISAVDLLKGIAVGASMEVIEVEGANGGLHTNYEGKAKGALKALLEDENDFVYVHLEGPDEMGHQGSLERKIQAIQWLDERILKPIVEGLKASGEDFRILVLPDHPTPIAIRTHSSEAVPYLLYDSRKNTNQNWKYNEREAKASGNYLEEGYKMIEKLLGEA